MCNINGSVSSASSFAFAVLVRLAQVLLHLMLNQNLFSISSKEKREFIIEFKLNFINLKLYVLSHHLLPFTPTKRKGHLY